MTASDMQGIDLRGLPAGRRRAVVDLAVLGLRPGQRIELLDEQDPTPLRDELATLLPPDFHWTLSQEGVDGWRLQVSRAPGPGEGLCCGGCGGAPSVS